MRFVQNHIRAVERAATHVGERGNFDQAFFHQFGDAVEAHQIVERVVERAQVGVDFLRQIAGQEAEFFTCFDGGADEDDAFDLVFFHGIDGGGDGEIGLAGTGRADAEIDSVLKDAAQVTALVGTAPADGAAPRFDADVLALVARGDFSGKGRAGIAQGEVDVISVQHAATGLGVEVFDDETCLGAASLIALHLKEMPAVANLHVQLFFNQAQMRV